MTDKLCARGRLIELVIPAAQDELERLYAQRSAEPRTGSSPRGRDELPGGPWLPADGPLGPMLVRDAESGESYGYADCFTLRAPSSVWVTVFLDPRRAPPGVGIEAYLLYARCLHDAGVSSFVIDISSGDLAGQRILGRLGLRAPVRMREHLWAGGTWHDSVLCFVAATELEAIEQRLEPLLYRRRSVAG